MRKQYQIRIEPELLEQIKKSAKKNDRTTAGEFRHLLRLGLKLK